MISPQQSGMAPRMPCTYCKSLRGRGRQVALLSSLDTLKKFTEMLDKKVQSAFFSAMGADHRRRDCSTGWPRQQTSRQDRLVYEGVGDVMNDIDNAYAIYNLSPRAEEQVLKFVNTKDRGDVVMTAQFEIKRLRGPYVEMMESFREADEKTLNSLVRQRNIAHLRVKHEPAIVMIKALKTEPRTCLRSSPSLKLTLTR